GPRERDAAGARARHVQRTPATQGAAFCDQSSGGASARRRAHSDLRLRVPRVRLVPSRRRGQHSIGGPHREPGYRCEPVGRRLERPPPSDWGRPRTAVTKRVDRVGEAGWNREIASRPRKRTKAILFVWRRTWRKRNVSRTTATRSFTRCGT